MHRAPVAGERPAGTPALALESVTCTFAGKSPGERYTAVAKRRSSSRR